MTTYNALQADIYTALGFPNNTYQGNFAWTGTTPSAGIIAAVEDLPQSTPNAFYGLNLATNEEGQTLQALVSVAAWTDLLAWQATKYCQARCAAFAADPELMADIYSALFNGTGFSAPRVKAQAALVACGLPSVT